MTSTRNAASARERNSPVRRGRSRPDGQRPGKHCASLDSNTLDEQCHPRKIFIGGLAHKTTTQHLRDYFGRFGAIVDAVVLRWPDGRSRGFGYVTLADGAAVSAVLNENHQLSGREVDVKRAVPGTNKLFVGGLPQNTTANELREHFEKFGVVSDAVVMIDPATSRSRGFGFVCFLPGQEGATAVTSSLQQYDNHRIRGKWIEVKSAAPPHKLAAKNGSSQVGQSYEELALAGALPGMNQRLESSPSPSVDSRSTNERKGSDVSQLGSPRKVELPTTSSLLQSAPPGLAPVTLNVNDFDKTNSADMSAQWGAAPWWGAANPFSGGAVHPYAGLGPLPPFAPLGMNQYADGYMAGMACPWGPPCMEQAGLSPAESLQRNLETYLRQSTQTQMEWGVGKSTARDPSVSTACSSSTHTEIERAVAQL